MKFLALLLLLPMIASAGGQSASKEIYLEEVQYQIESILVKRNYGQSTDYDEFMLVKLRQRLNSMTSEYVPRAVFTPAIFNKEPTQIITQAPRNATVFFFTEITGLAGAVIEHVWLVGGTEVHRISFNIGSNRWRTYSSITTRDAPSFEVLVYANGYLLSAKSLAIR